MRNNLDVIPTRNKDIICNDFRGNIIWVEGINDKIVFDKCVNNHWRVVQYGMNRNQTSGKENIINHMRENSNNQIAVLDKDYDYNPSYDNVFYTDYNDIENTAIGFMNKEEIYQSLEIVGSNIDDFNNEVLDNVINISNKFSKLWKCARYEGIDLKYFTNINNCEEVLNKIIDFNNNYINYNYLCRYYNNRLLDNPVKYKRIMEGNNDLSFRGHDFFIIMKMFLTIKNINTYLFYYKDSLTDIERNFIMNSIKYNWIKRSSVYNEIKNTYKCFY